MIGEYRSEQECFRCTKKRTIYQRKNYFGIELNIVIGICRDNYTDFNIEELKQNIDITNISEIAKYLKKTKSKYNAFNMWYFLNNHKIILTDEESQKVLDLFDKFNDVFNKKVNKKNFYNYKFWLYKAFEILDYLDKIPFHHEIFFLSPKKTAIQNQKINQIMNLL